jgi:hypothetical protein
MSNWQHLNVQVSRICLVVFSILIALSLCLLSVAGEYWPWYVVAALFAIPPIFIGPRSYRFLGIIALVLSVALIVLDVAAGRRLQEQRHRGAAEVISPGHTDFFHFVTPVYFAAALAVRPIDGAAQQSCAGWTH